MTSYTEHKSWLIIRALLELLKKEERNIDGTFTISVSDLQDCVVGMKINDFDFSCVKGLKRNLRFENYKIVYQEKTVLKITKFKMNM